MSKERDLHVTNILNSSKYQEPMVGLPSLQKSQINFNSKLK